MRITITSNDGVVYAIFGDEQCDDRCAHDSHFDRRAVVDGVGLARSALADDIAYWLKQELEEASAGD